MGLKPNLCPKAVVEAPLVRIEFLNTVKDKQTKAENESRNMQPGRTYWKEGSALQLLPPQQLAGREKEKLRTC